MCLWSEMAPKARRSQLPGYKFCHPTPALISFNPPTAMKKSKKSLLTPVSGLYGVYDVQSRGSQSKSLHLAIGPHFGANSLQLKSGVDSK